MMLLRISALVITLLAGQVSNIEKMSGPYLGQEPPGEEPVRFARNIIPDDLHSVPVFSLDGKNVYFKSMESDGIISSKEISGTWSSPGLISINDQLDNTDDPCLSPDGTKLYYTSYDKEHNRDFIYFSDLKDGKASKPRQPAGKLNAIDMHWQFSMASNGNIYYAANGNIYLSELKNEIYQEPLKLGPSINSAYSECTPYINPGEDLLIFARSTNGKPNLFISRKDASGNWMPAKALQHGINSDKHEMCPRISADGKYFFFISSREGLFSAYWVDAKILDRY